VNWVLVNGETETGITLHQMTEKPDAGPILGQLKVPIDVMDTALILHKKMRVAAQTLLMDLLPALKKSPLSLQPQSESEASYFGRRTAADGEICWGKI